MKRFFIMIFCCAGLLNLHGARVPYQTFELNAGKDGKPQIWEGAILHAMYRAT